MLFNLEPLRWIVEGNTAALYRGGFPLRNIQSQNKFHFAMENIMSFTMSLQKLQSVYI